MVFGICNLSIVPLRALPTSKSEMVNQVLFGESFIVLEKEKEWSKIRMRFDDYEGWINNIQYLEIGRELYDKILYSDPIIAGDLLDFITDSQDNITTIPMGADLPFYKDKRLQIAEETYYYEGHTINGSLGKEQIIPTAYRYLNSPYLWGGRTPFGIDCSGLTQMVYKICGFHLKRDASEQASQGEALSFIEESEPGDLAFFDNEEGLITHVGIIMKDNHIIHAHGKVRIDYLDHSGIYNSDTKRHTHKLRVIKKII